MQLNTRIELGKRDLSYSFERSLNKRFDLFFSFRDPSKPLPPGWEKKMDGKGTEFYVDHNLRQTTFFDPRLVSSKLDVINR